MLPGMQVLPNMCMSCSHLHGKPFANDGSVPTCDAFPERIPDAYWAEGAPHVDPDGDDADIVWELDEDKVDLIEIYIGFWGAEVVD